MIVDLLRYFRLCEQQAIAGNVILSFYIFGLRFQNAGVGGDGLFFCCLDCCFCVVNIRGREFQLARGIDGRYRHIDIQTFCCSLRTVERSFSFCERHFIVARINFHEGKTLIDPLIVSNVDLLDISGNASADRVKMDVDLCIVRRFEAGKIVPKERTRDSNNNNGGEN